MDSEAVSKKLQYRIPKLQLNPLSPKKRNKEKKVLADTHTRTPFSYKLQDNYRKMSF